MKFTIILGSIEAFFTLFALGIVTHGSINHIGSYKTFLIVLIIALIFGVGSVCVLFVFPYSTVALIDCVKDTIGTKVARIECKNDDVA